MRESMEFDVVIVGAGPAGLACACRLLQQARAAEQELSVCVVEKGSEVGAHILSGALLETRALDELFPDWATERKPLSTVVTEDQVLWLRNAEASWRLPEVMVPPSLHNIGNHVISLGNLCRWLAEQAEALGAEIFPGFAAAEVLFDEGGRVCGIATGDMGLDAQGQPKDSYVSGMELRAPYTVFAEGCRGHLGKRLIQHFALDEGCDPQHYALGFKELWEVPAEIHRPGMVVHGFGWPLSRETGGGFFLYHGDNCQVAVGLILDLNYTNPHLSPFEAFQQLKQHPDLARHLCNGKRLAYGARAIAKGGFNAWPRGEMPGALLVGCDAGSLNVAKIKGTHTAMKSGMLAAEALFSALHGDGEPDYQSRLDSSWLHQELQRTRNFGPALHRLGSLFGGGLNWLEQQLLGGGLPLTLHDRQPDYACLQPAAKMSVPVYPKPDGVFSFDRLSSVFLSSTAHVENQPCHLLLSDSELPLRENLPRYDEPAQRYCPAGVYEVLEGPRFQINAQNCLHCKTCDIKDPAQNITWVTPEGGGGPNYPNM